MSILVSRRYFELSPIDVSRHYVIIGWVINWMVKQNKKLKLIWIVCVIFFDPFGCVCVGLCAGIISKRVICLIYWQIVNLFIGHQTILSRRQDILHSQSASSNLISWAIVNESSYLGTAEEVWHGFIPFTFGLMTFP